MKTITTKKSTLYRREFLFSLIALVPALILFVVFVYYPLLLTLFYSVTDWNGFSKNFNFVGLDNFILVFSEESNLKAFWNTIYLSVIALVSGFLIQFPVALALSKKMKGKSIIKPILYTPALISPLIVSFIWTSFLQYNGVINQSLHAIGLKTLNIDWLGDTEVVKNSLVIVNNWQFTGLGAIILLAGINAIPPEIIEAANLDGAVGLKEVRFITLPLIMPVLTISLFLGITGTLKIFELPFILTNGGPREASTTIVLTIFNNAFQYNRAGVSSALGLTFFVFVAIITLFQLTITRKKEVEY